MSNQRPEGRDERQPEQSDYTLAFVRSHPIEGFGWQPNEELLMRDAYQAVLRSIDFSTAASEAALERRLRVDESRLGDRLGLPGCCDSAEAYPTVSFYHILLRILSE